MGKSSFVVGLPDGFTQHVKDFADERGINSLYEQLLAEPVLGSDEWFVFDADQHVTTSDRGEEEEEEEQWFAQRFKSQSWGLNVHYIGPWNRAARTSLFRNFGSGGFDVVLESIGNQFGLVWNRSVVIWNPLLVSLRRKTVSCTAQTCTRRAKKDSTFSFRSLQSMARTPKWTFRVTMPIEW